MRRNRKSFRGEKRKRSRRIIVTDVITPGDIINNAPPVKVGVEGSNFYINPVEVIDFLASHPEFYDEGEYLNLYRLRDWFIERESEPQIYVPFWHDDRSNPLFLINEYHKLYDKQSHSSDWLFPHLIGVNGSTLVIPTKDVFDLPVFMMLYILKRLTQFPEGKSSFIVSYNLGEKISGKTSFPIYNDEDDAPIAVINGRISQNDLEQIYLTLIRKFAALLPEGDATWNGSDESGTRIIIQEYTGQNDIQLRLILTPTRTINRGHGWTQEVEDLLTQTVGSTVMSVRNKDDNKCLIYCLILGLIVKIKGGSNARAFGKGIMMVEPSEIYAKGMYLPLSDSSDEITKCIKRLSQLLMPPVYSSGPVDPIVQFVEDIDKKAGTMISVTEFRKEFSQIEEKLIPSSICGIDVYGIDFNINSHIYPLYMSKNRSKIIELLCVTPKDTKCSHYCLIM